MKQRLIFFTVVLGLFTQTAISWQDINQDRLETLVREAEKTHSEAVIIYHNNELISEHYFGLGRVDKKTEAMSCTKSIVGLAVACMLSDGLIENLDTPVHTFYPEWNQGQKKQLTIKHLVHMTSGIQNVPNASLEIYPSPDFVKLALTAELSSTPGEVFSYNNKALNLMAGVIQKITGKRMDLYIGERLFAPLGITDFTWSLDNAGNPHVMAGCQIRPADFAKLGLLVLNKGQFKGKQILDKAAIDQLLKPSEKYRGYAMLWWLDYEKSISVIDDEVIEQMRQAKVDEAFIEQYSKAKGEYESQRALRQKLIDIFGAKARGIINEALKGKSVIPQHRKFSGKVRYRADGYLGNFIIIDPENQIVAVRMTSHDSHQGPKDNFSNFNKLVYTLTSSQ